MVGIGTVINCIAIIIGAIIGTFTGNFFKQNQADSLNKACGVSVLFIGIAGAMEGMLTISDGSLVSGKSMLLTLTLAIGTIIGEVIGIERGFECFGQWLKVKTGNAKDQKFVDAFVTSSLTVSIGAMAIVGAIQDGLLHDYSTLAVKSVLDLIIIAVMTASMGKGCGFSAIPVLVIEESVTFLAQLLSPIMTDIAVSYLSFIGSALIFCIGINLIWGKKFSVANMLPSLILAVVAAYLPIF